MIHNLLVYNLYNLYKLYNLLVYNIFVFYIQYIIYYDKLLAIIFLKIIIIY